MDPIHKRLQQLRMQLARKHKLETYFIWNNQTQKLLVELKPQTPEELQHIKGLGQKKISQFGAQILAAIAGEIEFVEKKEISLPTFASDEAVLSVSLYLDYINYLLGDIERVKVYGEISSLSVHPSGTYLTIKDQEVDAVLEGYINPYAYRGLGIPLEPGLVVKLSGFPKIFKRGGRFKFQIEDIELAGEGSLRRAYELLKAKLETEGIFSRKRDIPEFITRVGVITSRTGAVIDDFKHNLIQRGIHVELIDVRVEGTLAVNQIIGAFKTFNKRGCKPDVLVVMRGGGSLEDLQAFNQEIVARAVFASAIPVIAAVGHDRDVPLVCLAADAFVSTPTAAAVYINGSWQALENALPVKANELVNNYIKVLRNAHMQTELHQYNLARAVARIIGLVQSVEHGIKNLLARSVHTLTVLRNSVTAIHIGHIQTLASTLARINLQATHAEKSLYQNSPKRQLALGYSILSIAHGKIVRNIDQVKSGDQLRAQVANGSIESTVSSIKKDTYDAQKNKH